MEWPGTAPKALPLGIFPLISVFQGCRGATVHFLAYTTSWNDPSVNKLGLFPLSSSGQESSPTMKPLVAAEGGRTSATAVDHMKAWVTQSCSFLCFQALLVPDPRCSTSIIEYIALGPGQPFDLVGLMELSSWLGCMVTWCPKVRWSISNQGLVTLQELFYKQLSVVNVALLRGLPWTPHGIFSQICL